MTSNVHFGGGSRSLDKDTGEVAGAMFKLLQEKRALFGGDARPRDEYERKKFWRLLIDKFYKGTRPEMDAALRLIRRELTWGSTYDMDKEALVEQLEALLVFEDL